MLNKLRNSIGIILICSNIYSFFKYLNNTTKTSLYSDTALADLDNPIKMKKINSAINFYNKNGYWSTEFLLS